jgi:hypothetical protein
MGTPRIFTAEHAEYAEKYMRESLRSQPVPGTFGAISLPPLLEGAVR